MRLKPFGAFLLFASVAITAQTPAKNPVAIRFTAVTENVSGAGEPIRINLTNWSTDAERDQLVDAWNLKAPAVDARGRGGRGGGGGGGGNRGGGRGGRGGAAAPNLADDPDAVDNNDPAFRFGRGARGRGAADEAAAAPTPQSSLTAALKKATTVGILWTSQSVGYSIKYAYRLPQADGSERIILATDRRVGAWSNLWTPKGATTVSDYEFSVIELRLNAKGEGEGKGVLTGKVAVDAAAKTIALEAYNTLPIILKGVKRVAN